MICSVAPCARRPFERAIVGHARLKQPNVGGQGLLDSMICSVAPCVRRIPNVGDRLRANVAGQGLLDLTVEQVGESPTLQVLGSGTRREDLSEPHCRRWLGVLDRFGTRSTGHACNRHRYREATLNNGFYSQTAVWGTECRTRSPAVSW